MLVPCTVESVRVHVLTGQHVVLLQAKESNRLLPIWIGPDQAHSIATRIAGITSERPLTHDLMMDVIGKLGVEITRIVVKDLRRGRERRRCLPRQPVPAVRRARGRDRLPAVRRDRARGPLRRAHPRVGHRARPLGDLRGERGRRQHRRIQRVHSVAPRRSARSEHELDSGAATRRATPSLAAGYAGPPGT